MNDDLSKVILRKITAFSKYAKYLDDLNRRETWDETVARVEKMHIERYPDLEVGIRSAFDYVRDMKVLPSMRSMQFGGRPIELNHSRIYNCFGKETEFITNKGLRSFNDFNDGDSCTVLTHEGNWKSATVRNYGQQTLYTIGFKKGRSETQYVRATKNHRWILNNGNETTNLQVGDYVAPAPPIFKDWEYDTAEPLEKLYWCYGYVYGDGTRVKSGSEYKYSMVRLCKKDSRYAERFEEMGFKTSTSLSLDGDFMAYTGTYLKELPNLETDGPEMIRAFLAGWLAADGGKTSDSYWSIQITGQEGIDWFLQNCHVAGIIPRKIDDYTGQITNYGQRSDITYRIIFSTDLRNKTNAQWKVVSFVEDEIENVWCLEVEDDHSFVLECGISTGNCSFVAIQSPKDFSEIMFLLLGGTGLGYSVQRIHTERLPSITKPKRARKFLISDDIQGWADSVRALFRAYLLGGSMPLFDYSDIRPKGARLKTAGGKAPGPEPLRRCLNKIESILDGKEVGTKLEPIEIHDICCLIADAVLSGGIRRSALIALFDKDDQDMLSCKGNFHVEVYNGGFHLNPQTKMYEGEVTYRTKNHALNLSKEEFEVFQETKTLPWFYFAPQRARANNSAVLMRVDWTDGVNVKHAATKEDFEKIWAQTEASGAGEPAVYWTNDPNEGCNPCAEISLSSRQFCNLTTINLATVKDDSDFVQRIWAATFIGTLQAGYTDFHYLSSKWKDNAEKDALLGVSFTGVAESDYKSFDWERGAKVALETNEEIAALIGINPASRIGTFKPDGTSSCVLGTTSGIHGAHDEYWLRRFRFNLQEALAVYLQMYLPDLVEPEHGNPNNIVLGIPQKAAEGAIMRSESPLDTLERVKWLTENWIRPTHRKGVNTHNVSCTVNVKPKEWKKVGEWMWNNRDSYNGISVIPFDGGTYIQAPFETISEEEYNAKMKVLQDIDLSLVSEFDDSTDLKNELACGANGCEVL